MSPLRQSVKQRAWWDTKLCRNYGVQGLATILWARHLAPIPSMPPANDRDHIKW